VITGGGAHLGDGSSLVANLLGDVAHGERSVKMTSPGRSPDLSLMGLLARTGLLSPLAFRLWCYVRPFLS
jgi:hypothetical protein